MEKIFILIPWFCPAFKAGGPIRSVAGMIEHLQDSNILFHVFCSNKDIDKKNLKVPTDEWVLYSKNCKVWYSSNDNILPVLKKEIRDEQPQYLFINGLYNWHYNIKPILFARGVNKIISVRGMLHPGALSQKSVKKKFFLQLLNRIGWQHKNSFHVTDTQEKKFVENKLGHQTRIFVAGNFPHLFNHKEIVKKKEGFLNLISIGLISPMKNYLPVLKALEIIAHQQPEYFIDYAIFGSVKDEKYWQQCWAIINKLPANIKVTWQGAVSPSEIENALSQSHVFILPSKSENFGHSIIEALSAGRPVITSNGTPWNNLQQTKAGINLDVDEQLLIEAISSFVNMSHEELIKWSKEATNYARQAIDVNKLKQQYRVMFGNR